MESRNVHEVRSSSIDELRIYTNGAYILRSFSTSLGKGRFEIKEKDGKLYIRARYGHSAELPIEVEYEKVSADDVDYLYHGTRADVLPWILREGLKPMRRKYVHLTKNPQTALITAKRHRGKPVILKIDAKKFIQDGGEIFKASDEIYLAKYIPPKYIKIYKYGE